LSRGATPTPPILDIHLVPGLVHTKRWSRVTSLLLESAVVFHPSATRDRLTIRECRLGEKPNLVPTADNFTASINQDRLNRFLPDIYDPSARVHDPLSLFPVVFPESSRSERGMKKVISKVLLFRE
jgi:hypothetical protein